MQVLLDQAQYDKVKAEAERTGRSVGAVVREAIDVHVPDDEVAVRMAAAGRLLARTADPGPGRGMDWADIKRSFEEDLERKLR